ncbi:hypothetical protein OJ998_23755 [Solirubrobacter taibaiensis]|nr:hypothetical protein [Solirubrobacter taibaiensis]
MTLRVIEVRGPGAPSAVEARWGSHAAAAICSTSLADDASIHEERRRPHREHSSGPSASPELHP